MRSPVFVPAKQDRKEDSTSKDLREILRESDEAARKFFEEREERTVTLTEQRKAPSDKIKP